MNIVITGGCSPIAQATGSRFIADQVSVHLWCRCNGVDLTKINSIPPKNDADVVVAVAEAGLVGLTNLEQATRSTRECLIILSSIATLRKGYVNNYVESKRIQEQLAPILAHASRVNVLRLGHVLGTKTWPDITSLPKNARYVEPSDVAEAVWYIANAKKLNGAVITLDAGESLHY